MAEVKLSIAGRQYPVACNDGEETRLLALGAMVDEKAREAGGGSAGLNETRSLLFSALLLADRLHDVSGGAPVVADNAQTSAESSQIAEALEGLASRLENLAEKLEN
jgi:cell division protein ZapA